jgi:magnesium transporter
VKNSTPPQINSYSYNAQEITISESVHLSSCATLDNTKYVNWIDIITNNQDNIVTEAGRLFSIDALVVEDIINTNQRAKLEEYENMHYIVLKMFTVRDKKIVRQQVSFILHNNFLLSFRESDFGVFEKVVTSLNNSTNKIRQKGEDFLLYTLLDVIIDEYYIVLEHINDQINYWDEEIFKNPNDSHIYELQKLKKSVLEARKNMLPVRELISSLSKNSISYFDIKNKKYIRDLEDHMMRNVEQLDFNRDQINSLVDAFYSLQSYKMNKVMKALTGVSFVLLPITFITSLFGMNYDIIPFTKRPNGFMEMVGFLVLVTISLIAIALRRKWLSGSDFTKRIK